MPRILLLLILLLAAPALAQDDAPTTAPLLYGQRVEDSLTATAFYDWWMLEAREGDSLDISMAAAGGLEPLIGILGESGDLLARSEDGAPDSTVRLTFTIPSTGQYVIVATRVGNASGTSTGAYSLLVNLVTPPVEATTYQPVTFRCDDFEVTTAATLRFAEDPSPELAYRLTVYGIDGFKPVIHISFQQPQPYELCNVEADQTGEDAFTLPGEETRAVEDMETVSQLLVTGADQIGALTVIIGSRDGAPGRYMAVIEGFSIEPQTDTDMVEVRVGPLAAESTGITAYMAAAENSRLDPFMTLPAEDVTCDDAGRRGCEGVPSFNRAGATINEGAGTTLRGDRSDAGLFINPGNPDPVLIDLSSRSTDTAGAYALVLIGELPARPQE